MRARFIAGLALAGALTVPSVANATVVFQRGANKQTVWVAADDGSGQRKLTKGGVPELSPDSATVVFATDLSTAHASLKEMPVAGGEPKTLLDRWRYSAIDWSADGRYLATLAGKDFGRERLVIVDRETGKVTTIARGYFYGYSFSPASDKLVFSYSGGQRVFPKANLVTVPSTGGELTNLTSNERSLYPVWGPERIAFTHYKRPTGKHRKEDGPKFNIWTMNPDGSDVNALTNDTVPFLLSGLVPTAWSLDGAHLLTQFGGQDTTYAVTVNPVSGAKDVVGRRRDGFYATALSKDGAEIIGFTGLTDGLAHPDVLVAPYEGGPPEVLIENGSYPDWDK